MNLDNFYKARYVLSRTIRRTDLIPAPSLNPGSEIFLKPENLQVTGSFKVRGACFKISQLSDEEKKRGVIACSAGNHAQGVALGAASNGIRALICLPEGAPISKVEATRKYGAEICLVPGVYDDAYRRAIELKEEQGLTFIHPFNDELVIAGQGTIGLELLEQLPDVEAVIVPIGGGGLASGIAYAIKNLNPKVKVYGVQAEGAASMFESIEHHQIECLKSVSTIADGIAVKTPGDLTFDLCQHYLDAVVTVTEDEISAAILALVEQHKLISEGAGAVSVAAAMFDKLPIKGKKTICLVSGGNIDVTILSRVMNRGLAKSGRAYTFVVELEDKPGQLVAISSIVAGLGGNITSVHHEHADESHMVTAALLRVRVETRNHEHIHQIQKALTDNGFKLVNQ